MATRVPFSQAISQSSNERRSTARRSRSLSTDPAAYIERFTKLLPGSAGSMPEKRKSIQPRLGGTSRMNLGRSAKWSRQRSCGTVSGSSGALNRCQSPPPSWKPVTSQRSGVSTGPGAASSSDPAAR